MTRTKQILSWRNIAAGLIVLLPFQLSAQSARKDSITASPRDKRLVLLHGAHLQITAEPIWGDSVEAVVTVAVPDSCKNQRYLCRLETSAAIRFVTVPRYKWAVREDSLKILSAIPLQIRSARQSSAASAPVVKIHFKNLDHAAGLTGTATLEIISGPQSLPPKPLTTDSGFVSKSVTDSSPIAPVVAGIDSMTTTTGSGSFGIFYVVLAILLIFVFGGLSWLITWSQRRRFRKITAKTTASAFPYLQHLEPAPAQNNNPAINETATGENVAAEIPEATSPSSNLPAVAGQENQVDLVLVLSQLHELRINLQQIIANQHEANQRLTQIAAAAALEAPRASAQLALFDILNDDSPMKNGENYSNGNGAPHLRLQPHNTDSLPGELDAPITAQAAVENKTEDKNQPANLHPASSLRIFFANAESRNETSDEVLLH
jgi:hypothetical protein